MTATTHSDSTPLDSEAKSAEATDKDDTGLGARPSFTITEAASACAVSRKTITRKLAELGEAGAAKDADGIWRIPVEALLSVGLHPGRSLNPVTARREPVVDLRSTRQAPAEIPQAPETITVPRDRWDDMRIRLARAEAESTERGRALEDARLALRALTAGPAAMPAPMMDSSANVTSVPWEPTPSPAPRNESMLPARGVGDSVAHEGAGAVPEPVPGLPPTPVPRSLAADSAVWDTLLPRATASANSAPGIAGLGAAAQAGVAPMGAQSGANEAVQHFTTAEPPAPGQVVVTPRRRWWGGKR